MKALVLADGAAPNRDQLEAAWPGWSRGVRLVVAADGGARHAPALGVALDAWVGDGDSVDPAELRELEANGVAIRHVASEKDESDSELAVLEALRRGAIEIVILGALGGVRFDHALANVGLLAMPQLADRPAMLLDERTRIRLITGPRPDGAAARLELPGRLGDLVSLLPYGDGVQGVSTDGLAYPLDDEPLPAGPARGLSNVRAAADAAITVRHGRLLVVETPATLVR